MNLFKITKSLSDIRNAFFELEINFLILESTNFIVILGNEFLKSENHFLI